MQAILESDVLIVGPGGLYTSLVSNLLVDGITRAILKSKATKIFVVNLMNRHGQTENFHVSDYLREMEKCIGKDVFDYVIVNNQMPPPELMDVYRKEGDLVRSDFADERIIETALLGEIGKQHHKDLLKRCLIRHDPRKLADEIMKLVLCLT